MHLERQWATAAPWRESFDAVLHLFCRRLISLLEFAYMLLWWPNLDVIGERKRARNLHGSLVGTSIPSILQHASL